MVKRAFSKILPSNIPMVWSANTLSEKNFEVKVILVKRCPNVSFHHFSLLKN